MMKNIRWINCSLVLEKNKIYAVIFKSSTQIYNTDQRFLPKNMIDKNMNLIDRKT